MMTLLLNRCQPKPTLMMFHAAGLPFSAWNLLLINADAVSWQTFPAIILTSIIYGLWLPEMTLPMTAWPTVKHAETAPAMQEPCSIRRGKTLLPVHCWLRWYNVFLFSACVMMLYSIPSTRGYSSFIMPFPSGVFISNNHCVSIYLLCNVPVTCCSIRCSIPFWRITAYIDTNCCWLCDSCLVFGTDGLFDAIRDVFVLWRNILFN